MTGEAISWLGRFGPDQPSERDEFIKLVGEAHDAYAKYQALVAAGVGETEADIRSRWWRAAHLLNLARRAAVRDLGTERGWRIGGWFELAQLRGRRLRDRLPVWCSRRIEHLQPTYFYSRESLPVAILSSCWRSNLARCQEMARREGLRTEQLPLSWYDPELAVGQIYRRP